MFEDIQHKFISAVLQEFKNVFEIYISNTSSASDIHRETLRTNHTHGKPQEPPNVLFMLLAHA
jgi:hypothetical protein